MSSSIVFTARIAAASNKSQFKEDGFSFSYRQCASSKRVTIIVLAQLQVKNWDAEYRYQSDKLLK